MTTDYHDPTVSTEALLSEILRRPTREIRSDEQQWASEFDRRHLTFNYM